MSNSRNKTAIITGAASGLGRALLELLLKDDWKVAAIDCNHKALCELDSVKNVLTYHVDILNYKDVHECISEIFNSQVNVSLFINNAGRAAFGSIVETPIADWQWAYSVNIVGTINCTKIITELFKAQGHGHIHFVSSAAAFSSLPNMAVYNSSKAALLSIAETLNSELVETNIKTSISMPSFFETKLLKNMKASESAKKTITLLMKNSNYTAKEAADDILKGVKANDFYIFAPKRIKGLWRWKRFLPNHYLARIPIIIKNKLLKYKSDT